MANDDTSPTIAPATHIQNKPGLLQALSTVSSMTIVSRISGLARDIVVAVFFGADAKTDAFFVAFKIPNFFRRLFAEGSFAQAFIPIFAEYKEKRGLAALRGLVSHVGGALASFLILLTTLMATTAPMVILVFGPGFEAERHQLAASMLRYTAFYLLFVSLVALAGSIQNSFHRFAVPAFTPVLLNLSMVASAIWIAPHLDIPVMALAIGTLIAGITQLLFQIPFLIRLGMLPWPRFNWQHEGMRKVLRLMLPAMLSSSVTQISLMLDTIMASFLIAGSVTWLYFSDRMVELPLGVFSIAIATVLLPSLSRKFAQQDQAGFSHQLDWGMRLNTMITLPAAIGLAILAGPILITLVQYGKFDAHDAMMARISLIAYAIGLPAFGYVKILLPGFFARHDTRTPLKITVYSIIIKLVLTVALVLPLYLHDIPWAHFGLALATSLTAWIQAIWFYFRLRSEKAYQPNSRWLLFLTQVFFAAFTMALVLMFCTPEFDSWIAYSLWQRVFALSALIIPTTILFFIILWISGIRLKHFRGHKI